MSSVLSLYRFRILRSYLKSAKHAATLFGGGARPTYKQEDFTPPTKQAVTNPVDILKRNDVLAFSAKPVNYIETVTDRGFHLSNQVLIELTEGNITGCMLIGKETFEVDFSNNGVEIDGINVTFDQSIMQVFDKIHPKPEILCIGLGNKSRRLAQSNRDTLSQLGIQIETGQTRTAARLFDLLSTERPGVIGALMLPPNV